MQRLMPLCCVLAVTTCAAFLAVPVHAAGGSSPLPPCLSVSGEQSAVARVIDPETFVLDTGQQVRLKGIVTPRGIEHGSDAENWGPERDALTGVRALLSVSGRVELHGAQNSDDRYGRLHADAVVVTPAGAVWVQGQMVSDGHARVSGGPQSAPCQSELLSREAQARAQRHGLWANPAYAIRAAYKTKDLATLTGTFQLVEGRVTAAAATKSRLYLNFGDNWKWDFTAALPMRRGQDRDALLVQLKAMEGKTVRVRGWLEQRNGPLIEVGQMGDIEVLD